MGKFLNSDDYFICSGGIAPAQIQNSQRVAGKQAGSHYLTTIDIQTKSYGDFVCQKLVLLMALIAALIAATGGAALAAIIAMAVAAGGGAIVLGGLICGNMAAMLRTPWLPPKANVFLGPIGMPALTDKAFMTCAMGGQIRLAPNIKTWWQAMLVTASNTALAMLKAVMAGAAVAAVIPLAAEGVAGFLTQAAYNWFYLLTTHFGVGLRLFLGANEHIQNTYVKGNNKAFNDNLREGYWSIETALVQNVKNLFTGNAGLEDLVSILSMGVPAPKAEAMQKNAMNNAENTTSKNVSQNITKVQKVANDNAFFNEQPANDNGISLEKSEKITPSKTIQKELKVASQPLDNWEENTNPENIVDNDNIAEHALLIMDHDNIPMIEADLYELVEPQRICTDDPAPQTVKDFENTVRDAGIEYGQIFSEQGTRLSDIMVGNEFKIPGQEFYFHLDIIANTIFSHNHPAKGLPELSPEDINIAVSQNLLEIRAVDKNGTVHSLKRNEGGWKQKSYEEIKDLWKEAEKQARDENGKLDHELFVGGLGELAKKVNGTYEVFEPNQDITKKTFINTTDLTSSPNND